MKKLFLILSLFFVVCSTSIAEDGWQWDIMGHLTIEEISGNYYLIYCTPPYDEVCVRLIINDQGELTVQSSSSNPNNPISQPTPIESDYVLTEHSISFTIIEED